MRVKNLIKIIIDGKLAGYKLWKCYTQIENEIELFIEHCRLMSLTEFK